MTAIELTNPAQHFDETAFGEDIALARAAGLQQVFMRRRVAFYMDGYRYAHDAAQKRWGIDFVFYETGKQPVKRVFQSLSFNDHAATAWLERMRQDPEFGPSLVKELQDVIITERALAREVPAIPLKPEGAIRALRSHLEWWTSFFGVAFLWFAADPIKKDTDAEIRAAWQGEAGEAERFLERVYRPMRLPLSSQEQRDVLRLAQLSGDALESGLLAHQERYGHLALHVLDDESFDIDYYRGRVAALADPVEFERQKEALEAADREMDEADQLLAEAPIPDELKRRVEFLRWFMYLRTQSIDHMMLVNGAYKRIFGYLADRFAMPVGAVLHMTYKEIIDSLEAGELAVARETVLERANGGYAYFIGAKQSALVTGQDIDRIEQACFPKREETAARELRGQVAFKGQVRGRARVILDRKQAGEVEEGEILVTTMTSPEYVPAMKRAAGIVTNEGGVLCHAAIMSRELRKPCVIGTRTATDVIKTGQMVVLDAEAGIVTLED